MASYLDSPLPEAVTWPTDNTQAMAASRPVPNNPGSIIRGPDPAAGPIHCVIQDNLAEDCFHARFMYWAAYDRYFSSNYDKFGDRNTCPMLDCRMEFSDLKSMLDHLRECPHAGKGEYWCWKCWRAEKFPLTSCVTKRSLRSRSKSLIGSVRKALTSPLTRSIRRKQSNRHHELHREPSPIEKTHVLPPPYADNGSSFHELAAPCGPSELGVDTPAWEMAAGATLPPKFPAVDSIHPYHHARENLDMTPLPRQDDCFNAARFSHSMPTTDEVPLRAPSPDSVESRRPGRPSLVSPITSVYGSLWTDNSAVMPIAQQEQGRVTDADFCQSPGGFNNHDEQLPGDIWPTTSGSGSSSRTQSTDDQQPPTPGKDLPCDTQMSAVDFEPFVNLAVDSNGDGFLSALSRCSNEWLDRFHDSLVTPASAHHPHNLEPPMAPTLGITFESHQTADDMAAFEKCHAAPQLPLKRKPLPGAVVAHGSSPPVSAFRSNSWDSVETVVESPPQPVGPRKDLDHPWPMPQPTEVVLDAQSGFPPPLKRAKARKMRSRQQVNILESYVSCPVCSHKPGCRPELRKRSLERHMETHVENRPSFKCEYLLRDHTLCQRSYSRSDNLLQHQKRDHHEMNPRKRRMIASSRGRTGMDA